jgi:uncharacterized protein (TIGR02001 family)
MSRKSRFKASGSNDALFAGLCLVAVAVFGVASHAEAQTVEPATARTTTLSVSDPWTMDPAFNGAVSSDYVFRGVSQTEEDPALSAGVDLTFGQGYVGAWASNVSFPGDGDTNAEIDLYGGFRPEVAGFTLDLGLVGYFYTNQPGGADYSYGEVKLAASRAVGPATLGAAVYWSPDFFGASEDEATYVEANAGFSPADRWTVSGAVGRQFVSSDFDYTTWNAGVTYALTETLGLDVSYSDTDGHDFGDIYGARAFASLKAVF